MHSCSSAACRWKTCPPSGGAARGRRHLGEAPARPPHAASCLFALSLFARPRRKLPPWFMDCGCPCTDSARALTCVLAANDSGAPVYAPSSLACARVYASAREEQL